MNCVELQQSLAENEEATNWEQRAHLRNCLACAALVKELAIIISAAPGLLDDEEPSPRVWNSIEFTLRQEGLIRPRGRNRPLLPSFHERWGFARWLVPAAAALLVLVGIYVKQQQHPAPSAMQSSVATIIPDSRMAGLNDNDLLQEVSAQSPAVQAQYEENLRHVNQYIQDAIRSVEANPGDEEARRSLDEAWQEKAMLFDLAMDRSLQ